MLEAKLNARMKALNIKVYPTVASVSFKVPCAIITRADTEVVADLDGDGDAEIVTIQVDVYSKDIVEAATLARVIRNNMRAWDDDEVEYISMPVMEAAGEASEDLTLHRNVAHYRLFDKNAD